MGPDYGCDALLPLRGPEWASAIEWRTNPADLVAHRFAVLVKTFLDQRYSREYEIVETLGPRTVSLLRSIVHSSMLWKTNATPRRISMEDILADVEAVRRSLPPASAFGTDELVGETRSLLDGATMSAELAVERWPRIDVVHQEDLAALRGPTFP